MEIVKAKFFNEYKSYNKVEHFINLRKKVDVLSDYASHSKKDISANSELLLLIDFALDCVCKSNEIVETWQTLSNTQKRKHIANAFSYSVNRAYRINREKSTKEHKEKAKNVRVRLGEFLWQLVMEFTPNSVVL